MKPGTSIQTEMGKEVYSDVSMAKENRHYTVEEIKRHNKRDDNWLMINGKVYDLSRWAKKHPGGAKILGHYAGEDATVGFVGTFKLHFAGNNHESEIKLQLTLNAEFYVFIKNTFLYADFLYSND